MDHSNKNPRLKAIKKIILITILIQEIFHRAPKINGKSKTSSTSKTKKIKALKKNCMENGDQIFILVIKPHSKGVGFSNSWFSLREIIWAKKKIIKDRTKIDIKIYCNKIIYYKINIISIFCCKQKS